MKKVNEAYITPSQTIATFLNKINNKRVKRIKKKEQKKKKKQLIAKCEK